MSQTAPPAAGMPPRRAARPDQAAPAFVSSGGRQRRWSLALVAVLVTVGSGLAFVLLWLNAGERRPYLAVTTDLQAGQQIEAGHLTTVRLSTDPALSPVPASQKSSIVGQAAAKDLAAGSLLVEGAVGEDAGIPDGEAITAIPVLAQRIPSPLPKTGTTVRIYATGDESGGGTDTSGVDSGSTGGLSPAQEIATASVLATEDFGTEVTLTVRVSELQLEAIAAAVDSGRIHIAEVNGE